ncbi:MAG: ABC transporter permease [Nonlabens sp.]
MLRNYIKIAFRNLWKKRTFTGLNIIGLTVAFAAAFLLGTYALFELSSNSYHENADRLFQLYTNEQTPDGTVSGDAHPIPLAETIKEEVAGIKHITRFRQNSISTKTGDKTMGLGGVYADADYLKMFTVPMTKGNDRSLENQDAVVLSENGAQKLFGTTDVLGKAIEILKNGSYIPAVVTGVAENVPSTSTIRYDIIARFENLDDNAYLENIDRWDNSNHTVFLQLEDQVSIAEFEDRTHDFSAKYFDQDIKNAQRDGIPKNADGMYRQLKLLPFTDIHFVTTANRIIEVSKTLQYVILGIALLIIFIASVNFINMSIGQGTKRLKEVGMRKTLGANKKQLFLQLWGESVVVFLVALIFGSLTAWFLLEDFQQLFNTRAGFEILATPVVISLMILVLFSVTLVAGGYPALLMSTQNTLQALKGKLQMSKQNRVRNVLMVVQFCISIILISGTLVLYNQLDFMRTQDLGFNKNQVISLPLSTNQDRTQVVERLRNELKGNPNVLSVTASNFNLGMGKDNSSRRSVMGFEHEGREVKTHLFMTDYDYTQTLDIKIIAGRDFDPTRADSTSLIINETMAAQFIVENPLELVFDLDGDKFNVIGVIEDFHFEKADRAIQPLTLFPASYSTMGYAYIKVKPENLADTYAAVGTVWKEIEPKSDYLGSYLDENIDRILKKEQTMTTIISGGAILAIVLSCIGLFAISLLVVAQRRKEIGIRKVVGASISNITILLTKDFVKLVGIAFLIAAPVSYYAAQEWLQNYTYHMELTVWLFGLAGILALTIAVLTISARTIGAAIANPVDSLKSE